MRPIVCFLASLALLLTFDTICQRDSGAVAPKGPPPAPRADYASLEVARDTVEAVIRRTLDLTGTAVHMHRESVVFKYWHAADSTDGWAFHIVVGDTLGCPNERVVNALTEAGWEPKYDYSADGPDGGVMGLVTKRFLCVIEGRWDGGDNSDSSYVPAPGCEVTVTCVARREDDVIGP